METKPTIYYIFKVYYLFKYIYHRIFTPFFKIGWRVVFGRGVEINNAGYIQIGDRVVLGKNALIQVDLFNHLKHGSHKPKIKIGSDVSVGRGSVISAVNDIVIEDVVGIAPYCFIADNSHCFDRIDIPIRKQKLDNIHSVKIRSGAWLGWGAIVLPGVTIGKNSVIGAHSVVNKDIPDYCVAVGAPAKIVKKYNPLTKKWVKVR